ncbi:hypothetical protein GCM10009802_18340 [Streptomyces synnematoformans]|uniref:Uncharacterized protein n=1 Tax=Streptomyces synnematoformans TaxID=415721 RepID=A0ABN2XUA6_9ACTN
MPLTHNPPKPPRALPHDPGRPPARPRRASGADATAAGVIPARAFEGSLGMTKRMSAGESTRMLAVYRLPGYPADAGQARR